MSGRVLISGGAGFIGRSLVRRLLDDGREVTVLDALVESVHGPSAKAPAEIAGARFVQGDVRDADAWRDALEGVDLVYHLAAETGTGESMYRSRHYVDVNVGGTALLCDVIGALDQDRVPRRVVLASSRAVYGEGPYRCPAHGVVYPGPRPRARLEAGGWDPVCPTCGQALDVVPVRFDTPPQPSSVYGLTKRDQEELLLQLLPVRGVDVLALRLQNVYGAGQSLTNPYTGILSIFSVRLLDGQDVNVFEDGCESRDFVHVDDVVDAFARAADADLSPDARVLDVGSGRATSVLEAAHMLGELCGAAPERIRVTGEFRLGDIRHAVCDPTPLRDALGATAAIPLAEGVRGLVAWVKESARPRSRLDEALDEMRAAGLLGRAETA